MNPIEEFLSTYGPYIFYGFWAYAPMVLGVVIIAMICHVIIYSACERARRAREEQEIEQEEYCDEPETWFDREY